MKRPKDILCQPWHIQEYIKHLECVVAKLNSQKSIDKWNEMINNLPIKYNRVGGTWEIVYK